MLQDNGKLYIYIFLIDKPVLENRKNEIPSTDEDDQINLLLLYSFFFFFIPSIEFFLKKEKKKPREPDQSHRRL